MIQVLACFSSEMFCPVLGGFFLTVILLGCVITWLVTRKIKRD